MRRKLLVAGFAVLVIVIALELVFLFRFYRKPDGARPLSGVYPSPVLSPQGPGDAGTLYRDKDDGEDRTLLYSSPSTRYSGIGDMRLPGDAKILRMVIGSFEGWENIGNSRDRYILLKDPLSGSKLALMRIAFEPDASCDKRPHATALAVEDTLTGEVAKTGKKMHELSEEETARVLRKGDAVAVVPILEHGEKPFYDVHGVQCANWIIVRRSGGVINF